MTNETVTRDEFEEVKSLLGAAARYGESTSRRLDQLAVRVDQLAEAQRKTEQRLESFMYETQRILTAHAETIQQLRGISDRLEALLSYVIRKQERGE